MSKPTIRELLDEADLYETDFLAARLAERVEAVLAICKAEVKANSPVRGFARILLQALDGEP